MRSCSTPGTASIADVFAVQDEITKRVVGIIGSSDAPLWRSKRQNELRERRPDSLEAYECVLPTYWFYESFAAREHARARDCLERATSEHAIALNPNNAWVIGDLGT